VPSILRACCAEPAVIASSASQWCRARRSAAVTNSLSASWPRWIPSFVERMARRDCDHRHRFFTCRTVPSARRSRRATDRNVPSHLWTPISAAVPVGCAGRTVFIAGSACGGYLNQPTRRSQILAARSPTNPPNCLYPNRRPVLALPARGNIEYLGRPRTNHVRSTACESSRVEVWAVTDNTPGFGKRVNRRQRRPGEHQGLSPMSWRPVEPAPTTSGAPLPARLLPAAMGAGLFL